MKDKSPNHLMIKYQVNISNDALPYFMIMYINIGIFLHYL